MSEPEWSRKSEGSASLICVVCKKKKYKDVYSLEGKKCKEDNFISKFIKLVTRQYYDSICDTLKSQNQKNYVCRSCFGIVVNTYDSITRLQAGVAQSIKIRLAALQDTQCNQSKVLEDKEDSTNHHLIDTRWKRNPARHKVGKQGVQSLKVISINNKYPQIVFKQRLLNDKVFLENNILEGQFEEGSNLISSDGVKDASGRRLGLESLLVAARVVESDQVFSVNQFGFQEDSSLVVNKRVKNSNSNRFFGHLNSNKPGPLSWKQRTYRSILPDNIEKLFSPHARSHTDQVDNPQSLTDRSIKQFNPSKPGPLSWKQRTNRLVLPADINPIQAKNLLIKKYAPVHLGRVKEDNIFMCTHRNCGWVFLSEISLKNHAKHYHYDCKPHKCPINGCEKTFAQKSQLNRHIGSHDGNKAFVCNTCGKAFAQIINLKYHMVSHTDKADVKDFKCPHPGCDRVYKHDMSLKRHLKFHNEGDLPFLCTHPNCGKAYRSKYELKCHFRHHTGEKPYKCDEPGCGKTFRLPGQLTIHRRNHRGYVHFDNGGDKIESQSPCHESGSYDSCLCRQTGERPFKCSWEGCDAAYSNRGQLENHTLSHKGKSFICDTCGKTFVYKIAMVVHRKKMHTDEKDFVCQVEGCGQAFHFRFELSVHTTKFHNAKRIGKKGRVLRGSKKLFLLYPCPMQGCTKQYTSKRRIEKHLLLLHGIVDAKIEPKTRSDLLICPVEGCGSQFLTQRNLRYHKVSVHNSLSIRFKKAYGGKRFSCTFEGCQNIYETMTALEQHIARVHIPVPRDKMCFNCGAPFRHIQQLEIHRQAMHGEESILNEQKNGIYICKAEKCGVQFPNAEDLKHHVHIHMENPPYKCNADGCRATFLTEKSYNNHILGHSKQTPHICSFHGCDEKFGTHLQLLKHSVEHYGNYKCPVNNCGRMLISLNSARVHLFRHTGEKPYQCSVCGMGFAVSSNLTRHTRTHTGEKPFECKICLKRFGDKTVLITHIRRHTGEKPYVCKVCGSCFSSLASIKIHMRLHTGESPYVCTEEGCDKRFRDLSGLTSHKHVHSKAGQLCSQCGKVYRWGIKKHKCKIVSETAPIASTSASDGGSKRPRPVRHPLPQQLPKIQPMQQQQQQQQQQTQFQQSVLHHTQQLQPLSILLQQQQQQHQQHQQQLEPSQPLQIQPYSVQFYQSQPLLQTLSKSSEQPQQQQQQQHQNQLPITSIVQHQHQNLTQQQQQQQPPLTVIQSLQQPLPMQHQLQQLQPHAQIQTPFQHPHQQAGVHTSYVMGNMMTMPDQLHADISYVLDNNTQPTHLVKPDGTSSDPLIMHDLDSNYQIVYDKSTYS